MTEIEGGTTVWRRRAKRLEVSDLWIIAHWVDWNVAGIRWDEHNYLAQTESGEMSLGKMEFKTFVRRCTRLGFINIRVMEKSNAKGEQIAA